MSTNNIKKALLKKLSYIELNTIKNLSSCSETEKVIFLTPVIQFSILCLTDQQHKVLQKISKIYTIQRQIGTFLRKKIFSFLSTGIWVIMRSTGSTSLPML